MLDVGRAYEGDLLAQVCRALDILRDLDGRIIVTGMGKSGHIARKVAATLSSTGTPAQYVHPAEASHGDLGMITRSDAVLAFSWSGETAELADIIHHTRRFKVPLIGVTSQAGSSLARYSDVSLLLPRVREACPYGLAPTSSTLVQLALGDALAVALLESKNFQSNDFRDLHPGGKLGAKLRTVSDLMHKAPGLPIVPSGATMGEAIIKMTSCRFGAVGIIDSNGNLEGAITDGDVRRHMADDLLARPVVDLMNREPKCIGPEQLASEALSLMNEKKITVLFVTHDRQPIGILHVHDLLQSGVA